MYICISFPIKLNKLLNKYLSIHFQAINDMVDQYGGQRPPRPSFKGWPPCWKVFEEIADIMREVCDAMENADDFRSWMCQQLFKIKHFRLTFIKKKLFHVTSEF